MSKNRIFFIVFGLFLISLAVYVWVQPIWSLPTRNSDIKINFIGLAKFLFGLSPFMGGLAMFRNSMMPEKRKEPLTMTLAGIGILFLIISLLLSQKS